MKNSKYQFKTNINCGSCLAKVTPILNQLEGILEWSVDTASQDKILTVSSVNVDEEQIVNAINKAGFKAETLKPA